MPPEPTTTEPPPEPAPEPEPEPSKAIIIYRKDRCDAFNCYSYAHVFPISPGGQVDNPCSNTDSEYLHNFLTSVANNDNDYGITIGKFTSWGINMFYSRSNKEVGPLEGADLPGGEVPCVEPPEKYETEDCSGRHSLQADSRIAIFYCEW